LNNTVYVKFEAQIFQDKWSSQLQQISQENGLQIVVIHQESGEKPDFFLNFSDKVELVSLAEEKVLSLSIDLEKKYKTLKFSKKDILYRAVKGKKDITTVVDLTAGLLGDAVYFVKAGLKVHAYERNPTIFLFSYFNLYLAKSLNENINLKYGSFKSWINRLNENQVSLYFDPIYQSSKRKSLPSKEMQIVRGLVGAADQDAKDYILSLISKYNCRTVAKRSTKTEPLLKPIQSYVGTTVVYDVVSMGMTL
jgi:hypothetical protein